jgi:hypothetical protein
VIAVVKRTSDVRFARRPPGRAGSFYAPGLSALLNRQNALQVPRPAAICASSARHRADFAPMASMNKPARVQGKRSSTAIWPTVLPSIMTSSCSPGFRSTRDR